MSRFILETLKIILITLSVIAAIFLPVYFVVGRIGLEVDPDKNILVLGDSHTECAFDDDVYPGAINLSVSGCPLTFSYAMLRKLTEENPQIDTVILSFHPWTLTETTASQWQTGVYLERKVSLFCPFVRTGDLSPLFKSDPLNFVKGYLKLPMFQIPNFLGSIKGGKLPVNTLGIGGFLQLSETIDPETDTEVFYSGHTGDEGINTIQLQALHKIDRYCRDNGIKLILLSTPLYDPRPNPLFESFEKARMEILPHIEFADYSSCGFLDEDCFSDMVHLNKKGAALFTEHLSAKRFRQQMK